jgi:hypothetical protein
MSKYNHRMVIYYGLKTETAIIAPLKWPPSRFGRTIPICCSVSTSCLNAFQKLINNS